MAFKNDPELKRIVTKLGYQGANPDMPAKCTVKVGTVTFNKNYNATIKEMRKK